MAKKYVTDKPVQLNAQLSASDFSRADIRFHEVDHAGATFEARVFLNNQKADEKTPTTLDSGYAGSFHIFGHGGCFGDEGHCDVPEHRRPHDLRPDHPLIPAEKAVTITAALKRALQSGPSVHVTVVPVVMSANDKSDTEEPLKFKDFEIVTYAA